MLMEIKAKEITQSAGGLPEGRALFEIDLTWTGPALHTIMGTSGCGKSSFLKTLGGVWKPKKGRITISGLDFESPEGILARRNNIGFAFQNNALFSSLTVLDNLTFPHRLRFPEISEEERRELARNWLKKVDLLKSEEQFPEELSGGMQKRLGIARALILNPRFLFLDDPTAGLDPITSRHIADVLITLLKESSALTILVTNDPDRARQWGGSIHFLEDGALISQGNSQYLKIAEAFL
jgi:phospholipid/cholesterol/gamma-HCH transport system ATP-binding protein